MTDVDSKAIVTQYQAILAQYGIAEENVKEAEISPVASATDFTPLMGKVGLLNDNETPGLILANGVEVKCTGVTPPLILLSLGFTKSQKYYKPDEPNKSYTGFYTVGIINTADGKQGVVTLSRPQLDTANGMGSDLEQMKPGNIFRVVSIPTNQGFRIFRAVPLK